MTLPASLPVLTALVAAFYVALTALGLAIGYALERWWRKPIWAVPIPPTQRAHEIRGNLQFVVVSVLALTAMLHLDVARFGEESFARAALTFAALVVGFQVWFYAMHRAFHTRALVRFHRHHHESRVTTPLSGQSTSVVEALGWQVGYVVLPVLMSLVVPISMWGWMAYLAFNVVGNIFGHSNVEIVKPSRMRQTPFTYHALHHARWTGHYGFESRWADRLFGTEWKDWVPLHESVWAGQPLTSLKQRGDAPPEGLAGHTPVAPSPHASGTGESA